MAQVVAALVVAAFAVSAADQLWLAIPAGILALLLVAAAVVGYCPGGIGAMPEREDDRENGLGIPEARQDIDTSAR